MQTILEILDKCTAYFASKGIPDPKTDAQLLLANSLGCKRLDLFLRFDEPLTEAALAPFRESVKRRAKREPLQHIVGNVDFFGVKIKCDARALVPRPETETLCEIIVQKLFADANDGIKILDLGTGGGAIAIALARHFSKAKVDAVENSPEALALARENIALFPELNGRVNLIESDWYGEVSGSYDLIVSNPPYLSDAEVASAESEVRLHDPLSALRSDDDGIADLVKIMDGAVSRLNPNGVLACECGLGQSEKLSAEAMLKGYSQAYSLPDLSRRQRFLICKL